MSAFNALFNATSINPKSVTKAQYIACALELIAQTVTVNSKDELDVYFSNLEEYANTIRIAVETTLTTTE
ncbi:hypothetical protein ACNKTV_002788 [Vibrio parahaemolyticus]